ncbi:MAG: hypothetical protein H0W02_09315 [Ktedonobacteraceae bacterium]|nr:hypothetical protein [Ktedonobacteraceae bacterium]
MEHQLFTPEQLFTQAQGNSTALMLATTVYFQQRGLPLEDLVASLGSQFARDWEPMGAHEFLEAVALNMVAVGATLQTLTGDEFEALAVITDWPPVDALEFFRLSVQDVEVWADIFKPIAASLDLQFERYYDGNTITYRIWR